MSWRKSVVRVLVYATMLAFVAIVIAFQVLTAPGPTRRKVLAKLAERFSGASISLEAARLNLWGGINLSELRMARRDDLDKTDFLYVPSAVIYHDKEQVLDGKIALRKIVLNRPQLRLLIDHNGQCNLLGLCAPCAAVEHVPTIVIQQGAIVVEDHRLASSQPVLEIHNVNLTILNDPLPQLTIDGTGQTDVLGALHLHVEAQRGGGAVSATVDLPAIAIGPTLVQRLADFCPEVGAHLRQARANAKIHAHLYWQPAAHLSPGDSTQESAGQLGLALSGEVGDGQFSHARLPYPIEHIEAAFECVNIPRDADSPDCLALRFPSIHLTARANSAHIEMGLKDLVLPLGSRGGSRIEDRGSRIDKTSASSSPESPSHLGFRLEDELPVRELDYKIEHLPVTPDLFAYLPETVQSLKDDYKPCGPLSITHHYQRAAPGQWSKHFLMEPEGMEAEFIRFPYPLHDITGTIERTLTSNHQHCVTFDLAGFGGDRPVTLKGTIEGEKQVAGVNFEIAASNVPLDERLMHALPARHQVVAGQFHPEGLADIKAYIKRERGSHEYINRYVIDVHHAALKYDVFPYRLEDVSGELTIFPDHWECTHFHGLHPVCKPGAEFCDVGEDGARPEPDERDASSHQPGDIVLQGRSYAPTPEHGYGRIQLLIQGKDVQVNKEFEEALAPPSIPGRAPLQRSWRTLGLSGRVSFDAEVIDVPQQPKDIDVGVNLRGCSMRPKFFTYSLRDVSASVHYAQDQVDVRDVQAHHGGTVLGFKKAQVLLRPEDGFQVLIGDPTHRDQPVAPEAPGLEARNLVVDAGLLAALPAALRKGLGSLKLEGPVNLKADLVIDQKDASKGPVIWWDGGVFLPRNGLAAGVEVKDAQGTLTSCGRFDGQQLEGLVGILALDKAVILGQPVSQIRTQVEVAPEAPQTMRLRNLSAQFFGGQLGGEARVDFSPKFSYEVVIKGLGVQLEPFGRHNIGNSSDIKGEAVGGLHLVGDGPEISDLKGHGQVDIPNGKLYRLPVILDLLKATGLRPPDRTAFEQAHASFAIDSGKLQVQELDLIGNAISLRGQGTVNLDGSHVNLDFNADWGPLRVFPSSIVAIPQYISDQILKIKVRGKIGDLHFDKELMPGVVDPIKKVFGSAK